MRGWSCGLFVSAALVSSISGAAWGGVYNNNFNAGIGTATVDGTTGFAPASGTYFGNSALQLVDAVNGRFGSLQVPDLDPGTAIESFTATIGYATPNVQNNPGGVNSDARIRGTGLGLFFGQYTTNQDMDLRGPIPGIGSIPAGAAANGLSIELDTIEDTTLVGFRAYVNDVLVASTTLFNPSGVDIRSFTVSYMKTSPTLGELTVSYNNNTTPTPTIFSSLAVAFVPQVGDRFSINGSNDSDINRVWITDANIQTPIPEPASLSVFLMAGLLGLTHKARK